MKRFVLAIAVVCALSIPVLAGDVPTVDYTPPPPPPGQPSSAVQQTVPGDVPTVDSNESSDAYEVFILTILSLMSR